MPLQPPRLTQNMHEQPSKYVSIYVISRAIWVFLAILPAFAADDTITPILKGVQDRYNKAKTLQVNFSETYTVQGRPRQNESGLLTLRKPGRMRWDYTTPAGKLFLSDGKSVWLYTPDSKRVEKMKLKESEDMRAPLAFLLGKLDFQKEFRDFQIKSDGGTGYVISAKAKSEKLPYEAIQLTASKDFVITNLVVTGQDQSVLNFAFSSEKFNPPVNDSMFQFLMPAGATLVTQEGQ